PGLLNNDSDPNGDTLTAVLEAGPAHGKLNYWGGDGEFLYKPDPGFTGTDSFTYHASDGALDSNVATVTIKVIHNAAPVAGDDAFTTPADTPLTIAAADLIANDSDAENDPLKVGGIDDPAHGT